LSDAGDRERARQLSALLIVLLMVGLMSGFVQLALIEGFAQTFGSMSIGLTGVAVAYTLSRTRHYRLGATIAAGLIITACVTIAILNPEDHVWYGFMLIAVLLASTFLTVRQAIAIAIVAAGAVLMVVAFSPRFQTPGAWVPPLMLHVVLSPLVLLMSHQRAKVEAKHAAQLRTRERQLQEAHRLETLGRLATGISHDFNNVLTVVMGNSDLLLKRGTFDEALLSDIRSAGEHAVGLTKQLLAFARSETIRNQVINVNDALAATQSILLQVLGSHIDLRSVSSVARPEVMLDPTQFKQIVLNLAANARDAMPGGGTFTITTSIETAPSQGSDAVPFVALRFEDTGVGMDETTQASIFEPFFTTKQQQGGTGLGLAITYGIVVRSGGSIRVRSQVGKGTLFEVLLPCVDASIGTQAATQVSSAGAPELNPSST
jgi:signal transduction histidine kinase